MSNSVFPTLAGLGWSVFKSPASHTSIKEAVSGKESRGSYMLYPRWKWKLTYDILRQAVAYAELQSLMGFFLSRRGAFDDFLYTDPTDYTVTAQAFGTGDGVTTQFQLLRTVGGYSEPMQSINGTPTIYVAGTPTSAFTIDVNTGIVTFTAAPTLGQALTWTGSYYFRVRFVEDMMEFEEFMYQLWQAKTVNLISVKV